MTLAERLTDDERVAGLALLVSEHSALAREEAPEYLKNHRARRAMTTAHAWANIRGLSTLTDDDLAFAMIDAVGYVMEHQAEVDRFAKIRDMERRLPIHD